MLTHPMLRRLLIVLVGLGVIAALAPERSSTASAYPTRVAQLESGF